MAFREGIIVTIDLKTSNCPKSNSKINRQEYRKVSGACPWDLATIPPKVPKNVALHHCKLRNVWLFKYPSNSLYCLPISFSSPIILSEAIAYRNCYTKRCTPLHLLASRRNTAEAAIHNPSSSTYNSAYVCSPGLYKIRFLHLPSFAGFLCKSR
jgi:hypothetical protein